MRFSKVSLVSFFLVLAFFIGVFSLIFTNDINKENLIMKQVAANKSNTITETLAFFFNKTSALASVVKAHYADGCAGNFSECTFDDFYNVAPYLYDNPAIINFVVAPEGVVTHVYSPHQDSELFLGLNLFEERHGIREANKALNIREMVMVGPFVSPCGNEVIVGRKAVFVPSGDGEKFWGFVSVTLHFPEVLKNIDFGALTNEVFAYELWRIHPDTSKKQIILKSGADTGESAKMLETQLFIFNAEWYLVTAYGESTYPFLRLAIYIAVSVLMSFLAAFAINKSFSLRRAKRKEKEEQQTALIYQQDQMLLNRLAQQELIGEITKNLILSEYTGDSISEFLPKLGAYFIAKQAFVLTFNHEQETLSASHDWTDDGTPAQLDGFYSYDGFNSLFPATLSEGDDIPNISCAELCESSPTIYSQLKSGGVTAFLAAPIYVGGCLWGLLSVEYRDKPHEWSESEKEFISTISATISAVVYRKIYDAKLANALEQALQASKAKSTFLASMSHEIRTPINAILGMAEIQLHSGVLPHEAEEAFSIIFDSGNLLMNLINDILDFSKIEAGKMEITIEKYDILTLINDSVQLVNMRFESNVLDFRLNIDPNTPLNLLGDDFRIKQVLNNILSNAFKYTKEGFVEFSIFAEPADEDKNVTIVFRVSDTGQGMRPDQVERIYEDYTRFNMYSNRSISGIGLGMNITKRLLDLMNGEIDVESVYGEGSTFTVRLPQKQIGDEVCGEEATTKMRKMRRRHKKVAETQFIREYMPYGSVLVVDDVETNLQVARGLLLPYGLNIELVSSAKSAIAKIKNGKVYDVIFMDHMMPQMDGIEATTIIRELGYTNPIVALTANAIVGRADMFLKNGFDGFISKPVDSRSLNTMLNQMIRDKQPPDVIEAARKAKQDNASSIEKTMQISDTIKDAFLSDTKRTVEILSELSERLHLEDEDDIKLYITAVHGIKNALNIIGETALYEFAYKLETLARDKNIGLLTDVTPVLLIRLRSLIAKMQPKETNETVVLSQDEVSNLREQMSLITAACTNFDKFAIRAVLSELSQKQWPKQIKGDIDSIKKQLLHSDFKNIAQIAERLISETE